MRGESRYVNQLKELILQIQIKIKQQESEAKELLAKAARWVCPNRQERILLNELIFKAQEFFELEQRLKEKKVTEQESEMHHSYMNWFSSLDMLVKTFDVPLNKISFSDMSLKERGRSHGKKT